MMVGFVVVVGGAFDFLIFTFGCRLILYIAANVKIYNVGHSCLHLYMNDGVPA
jgi:hypothetical protein